MIGAGGFAVPDDFRRRLALALSRFGQIATVDSATVAGYFAVSTCLASNSLFLITRGPVWKAVRATSSIPGLLPPVYCEDGRVLVDGSLLDNVPVKSMRALKSGPNVVIGLKSDELRGDAVDYAALPSRGRILRQLLNPFARRQLPRAPGVATVLLRSLMVRRERLSDLGSSATTCSSAPRSLMTRA